MILDWQECHYLCKMIGSGCEKLLGAGGGGF